MHSPSETEYDVIIIGGGIHGVGVAQAAAAAGYRAAVVEARELAAGTSRRSSKLIHGGLRYLESLQIGLVRESLHEREWLLRQAPELVTRRPFLVPVYPRTTRRPWQLHVGLTAYWLLAGLQARTGYRRLPRGQWSELDGLVTHELQHVFQYWDAQTDDRLLTQSVMRSAESLGAELWCPAELLAAQVNDQACEVELAVQGARRHLRCRTLVNAAGPWINAVAQRITPQPPLPSIDLVGGTHVELPGAIHHGCYYVEAPQDRRAVFILPWYDRTLLGTTERIYGGDPAQIVPTAEEINYLLTVYRHYFPARDLTVIDQWAGLRVLPAAAGSAFGRSRETQLPVDRESRPRVLSVVGGKLTGYRATAAKVIERLRPGLPERSPRADTRQLRLTLG